MNLKMGMLMGCGLLLVGATGCTETVEPGDYFVFRVASAQSELSESCNLGANEINDTSTLQAAATLVLFAGQEGDYYLDLGSATLDGETKEGAESGQGYEFAGKSSDIEWSDPTGMGTKVVTTVEHDMELTIAGELITGEYKVKSRTTCTGEFCDGVPYACTTTSEFVGTEVEDLDLEFNVN